MRVKLERLRSKEIEAVMAYLLDYQVASYDPLSESQKVFLFCAQVLNDELRMRNPRRNRVLFERLEKASKPYPWKPRRRTTHPEEDR